MPRQFPIPYSATTRYECVEAFRGYRRRSEDTAESAGSRVPHWVFTSTRYKVHSTVCTVFYDYVCMVTQLARLSITRVRLPILLVVSSTGKMKIFPCPRLRQRIRSRATGSAVPSCVSLLISILGLNLVLIYRIPPEFRGAYIYLFETAIYHRRVSPEFIGSRNCVPMAFTTESLPAQGQ